MGWTTDRRATRAYCTGEICRSGMRPRRLLSSCEYGEPTRACKPPGCRARATCDRVHGRGADSTLLSDCQRARVADPLRALRPRIITWNREGFRVRIRCEPYHRHARPGCAGE